MAQIKNTFVKSKMNRDMDARLIPNGEYREGRNINISKSEGSDVGALENVKGNASVLPGFINRLNATLTPNEKPLEIIGMFTHEDSSSIYMFLTTFTDASKNQLDNHAITFNSHCYITRTRYNGVLTLPPENRFESTILVEGSFLNLSKTHPILGFNIIEDIMFWTDNRNQPRKLNIEKASQYAPLLVGRDEVAYNYASKRYYYNEDQISVAKYFPFKSISLTKQINSTDFESTVKTTTTEWLPVSLVAPLKLIYNNGDENVLEFSNTATNPPVGDAVWTGPNGSNNQIDNFFKKSSGATYPVVRVKNVSKPGVKDYYIHQSYGQTIEVAENKGNLTTVASVPTDWADPGDFIIFQLANPEYDVTFDGDREFLKDKFPRFSYRFKYIDNEYSLMAPFTQPVFVPAQHGSFTYGDEDVAGQTTELRFFENRASEIGLVINLPYYPGVNYSGAVPYVNGQLQRELHIKEIEILFKSSNDNNIYSIESIDIENGVSDNNLVLPQGTTSDRRNQFIYYYKGAKPYKVLPESDVTRVNDIVPVKAYSQETSGNRIMYGNYVDNHALPPDLYYDATSSNKVGSFSPMYDVNANPPIASNLNNKIKEYYNASLKQGRTYQVGVVLSDRYGRQSTVMISSSTEPFGDGTRDRSTVYAPYDNTGATDVLGFFGNSLKVDFYQPIPDISGKDSYYALNYPGLYNEYLRPNGWYSYKIVVKQQEQEYYNVFAPGSMSGNVIYVNDYTKLNYSNTWGTANLSLFGDNINKIPRDMTNVGPTDKIYGSKESLYFRVVQPNYEYSATPPLTVDVNRWNSRQTQLPLFDSPVVSIQPFLDMGKWTTQKGAVATAPDSSNPAVLNYINSISYPGGYRDSSTNDYIGGTVDPLVKSDNNPFVATVDNSKNTDRVGFFNTQQTSTSSTDIAEFSKSLIVAETKPKNSDLELYWETSTSGLISELNASVITGGSLTAPEDVTTFSFRGSENVVYDGSTIDKSLLASDLQIVTRAGSITSNPDSEITLQSVFSINDFGQENNISGFFILTEDNSSSVPTYNIKLNQALPAGASGYTPNSGLFFDPDFPGNWGNMEFKFTFKLRIGTEETTTVVKENNFFSNFAPSLGSTTSPSPEPPGTGSNTTAWDNSVDDGWAFSIKGEEPDAGQTTLDFVKQYPMWNKWGGYWRNNQTAYNNISRRNQYWFSNKNGGTTSYPVVATPIFPSSGTSASNFTWHNGSGWNESGAELYIKKVECAVFEKGGQLKSNYYDWEQMYTIREADPSVSEASIDPDQNPNWKVGYVRNLGSGGLNKYPSTTTAMRTLYAELPWKIGFINADSPDYDTNLSGGNFNSNYYLYANPNFPPFEWFGSVKNNNSFDPEGDLFGGEFCGNKITISVRETFQGGLVSTDEIVVYTKLYR